VTKQHKLRIKGPVGPIETVIEEAVRHARSGWR
jgi:hypothetical protein